jgi:hypothetical protein
LEAANTLTFLYFITKKGCPSEEGQPFYYSSQ